MARYIRQKEQLSQSLAAMALIIICLLYKPGKLFSDPLPLPSEEAPPTLFASLEDEELDLFVSGSWEAELSAGAALRWSSMSPNLQLVALPEIQSGIRFQQYPDLIISLWLKDRWFFDMAVKEGYELNSIVAGYQGKEGEFLQELRVGNIDIGSFSSPFFPLPEAPIDSLGLWAYLQADRSDHRMALRYDPADSRQKRFRGMREISGGSFDPTAYTRGRVYILPDEGVQELRVYLEDEEGSLQEAGAESCIADGKQGVIYLFEPPAGRLAVYYKKGGVSVGNSSIGKGALCALMTEGQLDPSKPGEDFFFDGDSDIDYAGNLDFEALKVSIDGRDCLLLQRPGRWSPFLHRGVFSLESPPSSNRSLFAALKGGEGGEELLAHPLFISPLSSLSQELEELVYIGEEGVETQGVRSFYRRYPFASLILEQGLTSDLYSPRMGLQGEAFPWQLEIEELREVSQILLEEGLLADSVSLRRNGRRENRFIVDYATGTVKLLFPLHPDDLLEFDYRLRSGGESGDLLFASQNRFRLTDRLSAGADAGLRWALPERSYTSEEQQAPGLLAAGGSIEWEYKEKKHSLSSSLRAGVSLSLPDTVGYRRIAGMNRAEFPLPIAPRSLYPASASSSFLEGDRGPLLFSDYYSYPAIGRPVLQDYKWNPPADQRYPYSGEDARIGPSVCSTGEETQGPAMLLNSALESGQWAGGRIPLNPVGSPLDLSASTRLDLLLNCLDDLTDYSITVRMGQLEEDLDGDGRLDQEGGPLSPGFSFDPLGSDSRPVGGENSREDSEDLNGDGRLTEKDDQLVFSKNLATIGGFDPASPGWQRLSIELSPDDRRALRSVTAVEIILKNNSVDDHTEKRLLVSDPRLFGSSFSLDADSSLNLRVSEGPENRSGAESPSESLLERFPDEAGRFNDGSTARCALFQWDDPTAASSWSASRIFSPVDPAAYQSLHLFLRDSSSSSDARPRKLSLRITDPSGRGISASFNPPTSQSWELYTLDLESRTVSSSDPLFDPSSASIDLDRDAGPLSYMRLEANLDGSNNGTGALWLDEIYFASPVAELGGKAAGSISYQRSGAYLSAGKLSLLSNLSFYNESSWEGVYADAPFPGEASRLESDSRLETGLLAGKIHGSYAFSAGGGSFLPAFTAGWDYPLFGSQLRLSQEYREQIEARGNSFGQSSSLGLGGKGGWGALLLSSELLHPQENSRQSWEGSFTLRTGQEKENPGFKLRAAVEHDRLGTEEDQGSGRLGLAAESILFSLEGADRRRKASADLALSLPLGRGSIEFTSENSSESALPELEEHTSVHQLKLDLQRSVGRSSSLSCSLGHGMEARYSRDDSPSGNPAELFVRQAIPWSRATSELYRRLFSGRLTEPPEQQEGFLSGSYRPAASLSYRRSPGSRWYDLFLPFEAELNREMEFRASYQEGGYRGENSITWKTAALNLFGELGRYPLFPWYRSDEISSAGLLSLSDRGELKLQSPLFWEVQLTMKHSLRLSNELELESDEELQLKTVENELRFSHNYRSDELPDLHLFEPFIPSSPARLLSESFLAFALGRREEREEKSLSFSAGNETTLKLPGKGELNAHLSALFLREAFAPESQELIYYTFGIEAGLGFKLIF